MRIGHRPVAGAFDLLVEGYRTVLFVVLGGQLAETCFVLLNGVVVKTYNINLVLTLRKHRLRSRHNLCKDRELPILLD